MTGSDTSIVGGESRFPSTVWEDLQNAGDRSAPGFREAFNSLAAAYWRPVYRYVRAVRGKSNEDAKDLTQDFFAAVFDPEFIARCDPERGSFRAFLVTSLRNFLNNEEKARHRMKRGGGNKTVPLEFRDADGETVPVSIASGETPEQYFDRMWAQSVLDRAVELLEEEYRARSRPEAFEAFRLYCLSGEPLSYREISARLGISEKDVDNFIYAARRDYRQAVTRAVRQYLSDPALMEDEMKRLFGGAQ